MCGRSSEEVCQQHELANFDNLLKNNYSLLFNKQIDTLMQLSNSLNPIIAAGPDAHGMSGEELNARQATAVATSGQSNQMWKDIGSFATAAVGAGTDLFKAFKKPSSNSQDS